jgi:hypothetical protein
MIGILMAVFSKSLLLSYLESVRCFVIIVQSVQLRVVYDYSYHLVMWGLFRKFLDQLNTTQYLADKFH